MNTPIPLLGMEINDNRAKYERKEFYSRMAMPGKIRELATLNRNERVSKGIKFQSKLRVNRAVKVRKTIIAKCKELGLTGEDLS